MAGNAEQHTSRRRHGWKWLAGGAAVVIVALVAATVVVVHTTHRDAAPPTARYFYDYGPTSLPGYQLSATYVRTFGRSQSYEQNYTYVRHVTRTRPAVELDVSLTPVPEIQGLTTPVRVHGRPARFGVESDQDGQTTSLRWLITPHMWAELTYLAPAHTSTGHRRLPRAARTAHALVTLAESLRPVRSRVTSAVVVGWMPAGFAFTSLGVDTPATDRSGAGAYRLSFVGPGVSDDAQRVDIAVRPTPTTVSPLPWQNRPGRIVWLSDSHAVLVSDAARIDVVTANIAVRGTVTRIVGSLRLAPSGFGVPLEDALPPDTLA